MMIQNNFLLSDGDMLNLAQQKRLTALLGEKQSIKFSCTIKKFNDGNVLQERIFLLTNQAIYNIAKSSNLIKSLVKKLINFQNKYTIKRKISLNSLYGITMSKDSQSHQFILHVNNQYDYRYFYQKKILLLKFVCKQYATLTNKKLAVFFKDDIVLLDYLTSKANVKGKLNKKPKEEANYIDYRDLNQNQHPDINYQLQYALNKENQISMQKFKPVFEFQKISKSKKYYTVSTSNLNINQLKPLIQFIQHSKHILVPQYIFSTKNKIHLIYPFLIGGNLSIKLSSSVRISKEMAYFYIAQIIILLQEYHSKNYVYGNFCLQNIFIKSNGYLMINGIQKSIRKLKEGQQLYDIIGKQQYISPEMILTQGYKKQSDIWKLGICSYKLIKGNFPYEKNSTKHYYHSILNSQVDNQGIPQFILRMLQKDKQKRATLKEVKQSKQLLSINWNDLRQERVQSPYIPDICNWKGKMPSVIALDT